MNTPAVEKRLAFAHAFFKCGNAFVAAGLAGYTGSRNAVKTCGSRLLRDAIVANELNALRSATRSQAIQSRVAVPLLSLKDVCARVGKSRRSVISYVRFGWLKPLVGGAVVAPGSELPRGRPVGSVAYQFTAEAVEDFLRGGPQL